MARAMDEVDIAQPQHTSISPCSFHSLCLSSQEPILALCDLSDQDTVPWTLSMHSYPPSASGLYYLSESSFK